MTAEPEDSMTINPTLDLTTDRLTVWKDKAGRLQQLHQGPDVLVLPNAWDRLSARMLSMTPGCQALASTSAGIAAALGYPDGERAPLDAMLVVVRQIVEAVDLPVTVDFEAGYAEDPATLAENVRRVVAAGAVGINLEDGIGDGMRSDLRDPIEQAERLDAAREALQVDGVPGVLNARVDVLMQQHGPRETWLTEAIERGRLYAEHGADCIYVPGLPLRDQPPDEACRDIERLVREVGRPVNLLASPALPPVSELFALGVRRVSAGSGLFRLAYATASTVAASMLTDGTLDGFAIANRLPHPEVNRLLA
jgi:2-methylisocitrate lyase-like PEP mutase family enzyme